MKISGKTVDDKPVVSGMYLYSQSHGLPLDVILSWLHGRDQVMDWVDYMRSALDHGEKIDGLVARIEAAVSDVYGREYLNGFKSRLDSLVEGYRKAA